MSQEITSEVTASVWKITAKVGDKLEADDAIMILESMKMEIPVEVEADAMVVAIHVEEGDSVVEGQTLATVE